MTKLIVAIMLAASAVACEIEKVEIPRPAQLVALHGVLSASAPSQVVLLERTRNGSVDVRGPSFELESTTKAPSGGSHQASRRIVSPNPRRLSCTTGCVIVPASPV